MGWFDEQIRQRETLDQQIFEDSFLHAAEVVLGKRAALEMNDNRIITKQAIEDILKYYHFKPVDIPKSVTDHEEQIDYSLRPHGIMRRRIELDGRWYRDSYGPVLAYLKEDGTSVALLPKKIAGYVYFDRKTGKKVTLNTQTAALFQREAYCFYKPLPQKQLGVPDLLLYLKGCLSGADVAVAVCSALAVALVGLMLPRIIKALTGPVLQSGRVSALAGAAVCIVCVTIASKLISSISSLLTQRIQTKTTVDVQAAMMMRLLSLPAPFFRNYSAGELANRSQSVNQLCTLLMGIVFTTGLSSVTSLLYVTQIFSFAPALTLPAFLSVLMSLVITVFSTLIQTRISRRRMACAAKQSGMGYAIISGVQKIKLAGAEKRIFSKWLHLYSEEASYQYNPPTFLKINDVLNLSVTVLSTILIYWLAAKNGVNQSSFLAFSAAFGSLMGAFSAFAGIALQAAAIRPTLEMAEPFLKTVPEAADGKEMVTKLSGGIELNNVCFRYGENLPWIIDHLSLRIRPGEYVAIVGRTGCGKSTLMRLLLGFEKPSLGAVYYDGKNIKALDLCSLRRKIGAVTQNGGLFQGDLYSNIVISAPDLTLKEAWEAAEIAGIAEDIRAMPMGMQTMVSEGQGGISGGQKQRIMIARAIAPKPKVLMLDEATSALDNKTQKRVSEALDKMGCTRIVIAHRLSTIKNCSRILVLDHGQIIEDGTYDELIAKRGFFAELVERQRLDLEEE